MLAYHELRSKLVQIKTESLNSRDTDTQMRLVPSVDSDQSRCVSDLSLRLSILEIPLVKGNGNGNGNGKGPNEEWRRVNTARPWPRRNQYHSDYSLCGIGSYLQYTYLLISFENTFRSMLWGFKSSVRSRKETMRIIGEESVKKFCFISFVRHITLWNEKRVVRRNPAGFCFPACFVVPKFPESSRVVRSRAWLSRGDAVNLGTTQCRLSTAVLVSLVAAVRSAR